MTWSKGRQLTNYNRTAFAYNGQGQRISKGNISYIYGSDGNLVSQSDGLSFMYDATGVVGIKYGNKYYAFRKDILGNVIGILDENGINIVQYRYDAWGVCKIEKDTSGKNLVGLEGEIPGVKNYSVTVKEYGDEIILPENTILRSGNRQIYHDRRCYVSRSRYNKRLKSLCLL